MKIKKLFKLLLTGIAITSASAANAVITFDSQGGIGFVGKGDIQSAFAWNSSQTNKNLYGVTFYVQAVASQSYLCEYAGYVGGSNKYKSGTKSVDVTRGVEASMAQEVRKNAVTVTGYLLNGYSSLSNSAVVAVGDACQGDFGITGAVSSADPVTYDNVNLFAQSATGAVRQLWY